jgi:two-component system repressor protein LuxO
MERTTVLLVDDSESCLFGLGHALRDRGLQLRFAKGAEAGLQALEQERIDVVVSDYLMPGRDGIEFLEEVARRHPDTVRVLMTAHTGIEVAIEAIHRARVHHFLQKPIDREALRAVVEQGAARLFRERSERRVLAVLRRHPELLALVEAAGDRDGATLDADEPLGVKAGRLAEAGH